MPVEVVVSKECASSVRSVVDADEVLIGLNGHYPIAPSMPESERSLDPSVLPRFPKKLAPKQEPALQSRRWVVSVGCCCDVAATLHGVSLQRPEFPIQARLHASTPWLACFLRQPPPGAFGWQSWRTMQCDHGVGFKRALPNPGWSANIRGGSNLFRPFRWAH
jgi:hypothetical protein